MNERTRAHTHVAEVDWLLILRQSSYRGEAKGLVGILEEGEGEGGEGEGEGGEGEGEGEGEGDISLVTLIFVQSTATYGPHQPVSTFGRE